MVAALRDPTRSDRQTTNRQESYIAMIYVGTVVVHAVNGNRRSRTAAILLARDGYQEDIRASRQLENDLAPLGTRRETQNRSANPSRQPVVRSPGLEAVGLSLKR